MTDTFNYWGDATEGKEVVSALFVDAVSLQMDWVAGSNVEAESTVLLFECQRRWG